MTTKTVKIRYIGPQTEGLWTADGEHGAFDFAHGEYVDVPVALAVELMGHLEPVPPGEPVWDADTEQLVTELEHVWELASGETLPESEAAAGDDPPAVPPKPKNRPAKRPARAR